MYAIAIAVGLLFNIRYSKNSTTVVCRIHYCCLNKRIFDKISQNIANDQQWWFFVSTMPGKCKNSNVVYRYLMLFCLDHIKSHKNHQQSNSNCYYVQSLLFQEIFQSMNISENIIYAISSISASEVNKT